MKWSQYKARFTYWVYENFRELVMRDWELSELILESTFEALRSFVESGGLESRDWTENAEMNAAEFELNQCYIWWVQVRPALIKELDSLEKVQELRADDQRYLERLIRVREWLQ